MNCYDIETLMVAWGRYFASDRLGTEYPSISIKVVELPYSYKNWMIINVPEELILMVEECILTLFKIDFDLFEIVRIHYATNTPLYDIRDQWGALVEWGALPQLGIGKSEYYSRIAKAKTCVRAMLYDKYKLWTDDKR
ncbi:hypothetical protein [Gallibacterium anatis]|uniref:hypothetical protein n=1 Tax=Gallibacterium anatis TaxID=750 RepID=UPI00266EB069|nr:hypothetical protein [Gallibacterium anatis]WKS98325.1 hypothetical protein NYR19_06040 [Gallibacterium anatis]